MTDLYHVPLTAVTKAARKAPRPITVRAPGTDDHWTWDDGWKGSGKPPTKVEVPDAHWSPPAKTMPKRPAPAKNVVLEFEKILAWWRRLYETGVLSSHQTDELAEGAALVDAEGTIWSVGIQSGQWYRFERGWKPADAPEPKSIISIQEALEAGDEAVTAGLAKFLKKAKRRAPEATTTAWAHKR